MTDSKGPQAILPGHDAENKAIERMLRVDHAGEFGAVQIYRGQLAVLGHSASGRVIEEMKAQEHIHLKKFETLLNEHQVRPTVLTPVWEVAGFALGAATALLGREAAMACTAAVEDVIDQHYASQVRALERGGDETKELKETLEVFRTEEVAHRDLALEHGAEKAPGYALLTGVIKAGCRIAIRLSERF